MAEPRMWVAPVGTDLDGPGWTEIGLAIDDGLTYQEPDITPASILEAWRRLQPRVTVFCPPADVERVTAWCQHSPEVRVVGSRFVPDGEIWMAKNPPYDLPTSTNQGE